MMFGPYDSRPSSGGVILALYQRKIPACSPGGRNYVGVRDAAVATVNALTMGEIGECYILAGHNLSYREAFDRISSVIGVKAPRFTIAPIGVKIFGTISSTLGRVFQFQPAITRQIASVSCRDDYYSGEKAKRALNLPITSFEDMVAECYEWFRENQMLNN
jgi:dihydroflavonol-4-reductase